MIKKKGKFLTTIFSCIPGGGQMYMGFMKEGLSLMGMFFFILFLSSWLNIGPMLYVLPVLWFYSFFDAMNKMSLDDEEFYCLEDHFLFAEGLEKEKILWFLKKYSTVIAMVLIVFGVSILFNSFLDLVGHYLNFWIVRELADFVRWFVPQSVFALFIIWLGVKMIGEKKKRLDEKD